MVPTPYLGRAVDLAALSAKKSCFLLGPRQTGKSLLVRRALPEARVYDLLDTAVFLELSQSPGRIADEATDPRRLVVIDEVQKLPALLDEVHRLIEDRGMRFVLTGSSARSLRGGGVNLLGGRARTYRLHPLTAREIGDGFDLPRAIARGTLPSIWFSDDALADLAAYCGSYLREEIAAEGSARNLPAFSRFLRVAAACNATIVNFTELARDAQVPRTTVYEYFDVLRDTLLLHEVPAWRATELRKPIASSKYYLFDVGVVAALRGHAFVPRTPEYGAGFETWLLHELVAHRDYAGGSQISHWRSTSGFEVDFVLGDHTAVEAKAKEDVPDRELKGLRALGEEALLRRLVCVSLGSRRRKVGNVEILPWREFLDELWDGRFR
jgi:predicted AAA+ superfamily ATPase